MSAFGTKRTYTLAHVRYERKADVSNCSAVDEDFDNIVTD